MTGLAYGLVWCKECRMRTALEAAGGRCPVCDPDQVNDVSQRAADELDRIDAVLAGADTSPYDAATWKADGSHEETDHGETLVQFLWGVGYENLQREVARRQRDRLAEHHRRRLEDQARAALEARPLRVPSSGDPVHDSFVDAFMSRRVVRSRRREGHVESSAGTHLGNGRLLIGSTTGGLPLGHVSDLVFAADPARASDDDLSWSPIWRLPQTMTIEFAPGSFPEDLMDLFFGGGIVRDDMAALARWEDDGGPCPAVDPERDFFDAP